ncbi:HNH endonuclease [uncultured Psychroserpens sp.]|uniref:HNH endonuclease n=1 Tax=uncultured Psychroserpens sp. TaxID=255436 RepID=UPI0026286A1C|nr:HNH endonuclease [uncultured Psychroserpens sp.]
MKIIAYIFGALLLMIIIRRFSKKGTSETTEERPERKTIASNPNIEDDIRKELAHEDKKKIMLCEVKTYMTGHQGADNQNAFKAAGIEDEQLIKTILEDYTWHYLDDIDENLQCTMQLVLTEVLEQTKPFTDSRAIYEEIMGLTYKGFDL